MRFMSVLVCPGEAMARSIESRMRRCARRSRPSLLTLGTLSRISHFVIWRWYLWRCCQAHYLRPKTPKTNRLSGRKTTTCPRRNHAEPSTRGAVSYFAVGTCSFWTAWVKPRLPPSADLNHPPFHVVGQAAQPVPRSRILDASG